ncbi:hypothetical protein GGI1_06547, partial [Acidithiobacillus sp. GGI-221]
FNRTIPVFQPLMLLYTLLKMSIRRRDIKKLSLAAR